MGIGIYLTWYFYSGLEQEQKEDIPVTFANANYFWILLSVFVAWLGHLSRSYRWKFLMEPLNYSPKLSNMYHSTMIGYVLNFTIPRSGEVARPGFLAKKEGLPFDRVFGTVVAERIIDVLMLLIITLSTWALVGKKVIDDLTKREEDAGTPYLLYAVLAIGIMGLLVFIFSKKIRTLILDKLKGMWEGVKTIFTMKKRVPFILHTLFIWITYVLLLWLMAQGVAGMENIGIKELMVGFVVGAAAIAITPGGIGLYPIFLTAALVYFGYDRGLASSFAIMCWVIQTVFLVIAGIYSLYAINIKFSNSEVEDQLSNVEK